MEDFIEYQRYISSYDNINSAYQACEIQLLRKPGIYEVRRSSNTLVIGFNTYEISKSELTALMDDLGLKSWQQNTKKGPVAKWLDKMAKANEDSFNGKRLDCCDLNN